MSSNGFEHEGTGHGRKKHERLSSMMAVSALLFACSGEADGGGAGAKDAGAGAKDAGAGGGSAESGGGDSTGGPGLACDPNGTRLILTGAFESRSTSVVASPRAGGVEGVVGGTDDEGRGLLFGRAADRGDAVFTAPGSFDVSDYPNNVQFGRVEASGPVGFIALAGVLTITEVRPVLRGTFEVRELHERSEAEPVGDPIAGTVSGCMAVP